MVLNVDKKMMNAKKKSNELDEKFNGWNLK